MNSPFKDKNGRTISEGGVVKRTAEVRTGTDVHTNRRTRRRETFARYSTLDILGTVKFGIFNEILAGKIVTFYIETDQKVSYDSYFWCITNKDKPQVYTQNLSTVLSEKTASECEVIDPKM